MNSRKKLIRHIEEIKKTIYGIDDIIKIFCLAKVSDLTILLVGSHATAKSALSRVWSKTCGLSYRICTSSEIDESLLAYVDPAVFRKENRVQMKRGELMEKDHVIIDEYFLWPNKYRAKLHQLLEEKTYASLTSKVKAWSFLANPLTEFYTGQIPEFNAATRDRVDLVVFVPQASFIPSQRMSRKFSEYGREEVPLKRVISWKDYLQARKELMEIEVPSKVIIWLNLFASSLSSCKIVKEKFGCSRARLKKLCASCNEIEFLCSKAMISKPRFLRATILLAKSLAWFKGKEKVSFRDVYEAIKYTLPHRLVWLKEEKTLTESLDLVNDLIQQFNEYMLAWKSQEVFSRLARIVEASREQVPVYLDKIADSLFLDVEEIYILKQFVTETVEACQEKIKRRYKTLAKETTIKTLTELEKFVKGSNLPSYKIHELLFEIGLETSLGLKVDLETVDQEKLLKAISLVTKLTIEDLRIRIRDAAEFNFKNFKATQNENFLLLLFSDDKTKQKFLKVLEGDG